MKRLGLSLIPGAALCGIAWCFGYNFDHRGFALGMIVYGIIGSAVMAYLWLGTCK